MIHLLRGNCSRSRKRTGSVMILVLIAVAVAFVMGLTFLANSTTMTGVAQTMTHHAQARQIAESGLAMAVRYVQQTPEWRDVRSSGTWVPTMNLHDGIVSISGEFTASEDVSVNDFSFEQAVGQLANPLVAPPMSGTIGGWQLERTADVQSGPTVPGMSIDASAGATEGSNAATVSFSAAVNGTGTFRQTLVPALSPNTIYELAVDIKTAGIPLMNGAYGFRVLAGTTTIASTDHAATLTLPAPPGEVPVPPVQPPTLPEMESVLQIFGLSGGFSQYTLQFATGDTPPSGWIRLELFARSMVGLAFSVTFDNVRMESYPSAPLLLTSVGRHGDASCRVSAAVSAVDARVVKWSDS